MNVSKLARIKTLEMIVDIVLEISRDGLIRTNDLAKALNISRSQAYKYLRLLELAGVVENLHIRSKGIWKIQGNPVDLGRLVEVVQTANTCYVVSNKASE